MLKDFPKLETPFERVRNGRKFTLRDKLANNFDWFLNEEIDCVEKLDGTNVCIKVENGEVVEAYNRNTKIELGSGKGFDKFITEGLEKTKENGWLKDGIQYGELIGKNINQNRHKMDFHLWVPFDWLRENCKYENCPRIYTEISEYFKNLPSLFNKKMNLPETTAEGIVFYRKKTNAKAKIRRDMFDWCEERGHKILEMSTATTSQLEGKMEGDTFIVEIPKNTISI